MHPILRLGLLLAHLGQVDGRKKFQKLVYILQVLGAPFPEHFELSLYGTYSADLRAELDAFLDEKLIVEEPMQASRFITYKLTPSEKLQSLLKDYHESGQGTPRWVKWAKDLNTKSAQDLEGISTVLYFAQYAWPEAQWQVKFQELKPQLSSRFAEFKSEANQLRQRIQRAS